MRIGLGLSVSAAAGAVASAQSLTAALTSPASTAAGTLAESMDAAGALTSPASTASATVTTTDYPASLSLTAWWRGAPNLGVISGETSAGTSASQALSEFTNAPSAGTAVNGYTPSDYDGTNDEMTADDTLDTYIAATAFSGWALVYLDTNTGDILLDTGLKFVVSVNAGTAFVAVNGTAHADRAISTGGWHLVTFRYNGTNLQVGVDEAPGTAGGASSVAYSSSVTPLTGTVHVGKNLAYGFLNGKVLEMAVSDTALSDGTFDNVITYVNGRYGLSL